MRTVCLDPIHRITLHKAVIASFTFGHSFLSVVSICNEGTRLGRRTRWIWVKLDSSAADELFVLFHYFRLCRCHPCMHGFPTLCRISIHSSPRATVFPAVIKSSSSTSTTGSEPPTRPSSPPGNWNSTDKVPTAHKYTSNVPALLQFGHETKGFFPPQFEYFAAHDQ